MASVSVGQLREMVSIAGHQKKFEAGNLLCWHQNSTGEDKLKLLIKTMNAATRKLNSDLLQVRLSP